MFSLLVSNSAFLGCRLPRETEVMGTLRRSLRSSVDMDDRGWTLLHIGCRKGDLKQVNSMFSVLRMLLNVWL